MKITSVKGRLRKTTPLPARADVPDARVLDVIISHARLAMNVSAEALFGGSKHPNVTACRRVAVHVARKITNASYAEITVFLGRTNHTTTISAHQRLMELLALPRGCPERAMLVMGLKVDVGDMVERVTVVASKALKGGAA